MEIRKYQLDAIANLKSKMERNAPIILQSATGSGKSVIFAKIVQMAAQKGSKVLVVTHRTEIFKSTLNHLGSLKCEEISADRKTIDESAQIFVGMIETLKSRIKRGFTINPDLVIIDECHIQSFNSIFEHYPNAYIIGVSATPIGKHIFKYYKHIVSTIEIKDLIEQGFLVPCRPFQMQDDFSDLKKINGEFSDQSLYNHFSSAKLFNGVIENCMKFAKDKKTAVFNVNIKHCHEMNNAFNNAGIESKMITGDTDPVRRAEILRAFDAGEFKVLNSVGTLTTGWDCPSVECVVLNRATTSLTLFMQMQGRASRPFPGKKEFIVLDFGGNHDRFGLWEEEREWKIEAPKKKKEAGPPAIRICSGCEAVLPKNLITCSYCGQILSKKEKDLLDGVMVEVEKILPPSIAGKYILDLSLEEIAYLQKHKIYSSTFCWRVVRNHGSDAIREYQYLMGYSKGWSFHQSSQLSDCQISNFKLK